jgi:hypothetical protein
MTIKFNTDNAAFEENFAGECIRILQHVIERMEEGDDNGTIMDVNGNRIGTWSY